MNIIFVCQRFYKTNPTSLCVWAVVKKLVELGHKCRIVTASGVVFDSCKSNELKNSSDLEPEKNVGRVKRVFNYISFYRTWPYEGEMFNENLYQQTKSEIDKLTPDVIITPYNYLDSVVVGHKIKEEYGTKILFIPYFLDGLLAGPSMWLMSKSEHDKRAIAVENQILSNADAIVMMKSAKTKYEKEKGNLNFCNKIVYLDLPLYEPRNSNSARSIFPSDQIILFFAGSMPKHIRNPKFFLQVFNGIKVPNIHFYIAGSSAYSKDLHKAAKKDSRIHILGLVPHEDVCNMQMEADVLVNIGNSLVNMMPSKVFEYMSTGKKIIMTYRLDNDPSVEYMNCYGRALMIDERNSIAEAVKETQRFIQDSDVSNNSICVEKLYDNTPDSFARMVENLYSLGHIR